MKITNATTERIRERMGSEATTEQAERMVKLLRADGITDTDDVSDAKWFELVAEACAE